MEIEPPSPLGTIHNEISAAQDAGLHYAALLIALTLPDICKALEGIDQVKKEHYVSWCDQYLMPVFFPFGSHVSLVKISGEDIYRLRYGVVHRGDFAGHRQSAFIRVIFTLPIPNQIWLDLNRYETDAGPIVCLEAVKFCDRMIIACERWYDQCKADSEVQKNLPDLVRYRPDGYPSVYRLPLIT
jgi:hypothetical protein